MSMTAVSLVDRRVPLAAGLAVPAIAVCLAGAALGSPQQQALMWGSWALTAWCTGLILLAAVARGDRELGLAEWKLGPWTLAWCTVTSGLATATWSSLQSGSAAQITIDSILKALWLVAVAMTAWAVGYCLGPRGIVGRHATQAMVALQGRYSYGVRSAAVPWVLYAIGTAARLLTLALTGRLGYVGDAASAVSSATGYGQLVSVLSLMCPIAICLSAVRAWREGAAHARTVTAVLFLAEVAFGAVAGQKQNFIVAVLAVVLPYAGARRRLPKRVLTAGMVAFLLLVIPFTSAYRHTARGGSVTLTAGQAASGAPAVLRRVLNADTPTVLPQSVAYLAQRVQEIDAPAIIIQRTPAQIPYASPLDLLLGPITDVIPRALWPGKPILDTGYQFSQLYYGLPASIYSSSAITPAGDLYRHGGWVPVLAGMFVLGTGIRVLDDVLDIRASPHAAILVLLLFPEMVKAEDDWITLVAGIPAVIVTWLAVVAFSFARQTERPRVWPARRSNQITVAEN